MTESFTPVSFVLGFLTGAIVMLILIWLAYFTRSFLFTYCPTQAPPCSGGDYYNDPGDALASNPQITAADILFLNDDNQLFYKRVVKNTGCIPESNQLVHITYPQYCSFSGTGGVSGTWRETAFNSNIYVPDGFVGPNVVTNGDCDPAPGSLVDVGVPLLRWDANPISR